MQVWKLVWERPDGCYVSWFSGLSASNLNKESCMVYKIGEKSVRSNRLGPLMAFKSKATAISFLSQSKLYQAHYELRPVLLFCTARKSRTITTKAVTLDHDFFNFWKYQKNPTTRSPVWRLILRANTARPPKGTVNCASIIPLHKVEI